MQLQPRHCPICGAKSDTVHCAAALDLQQLDAFAFASRKFPQRVYHRMVRCLQCDLIYADPAPTPDILHEEYHQADFDSSEEAACAARTYAQYLPTDVPHGKSLDIGTGGGEFVGQLLLRGFDAYGVEPSPAARDTATDAIKPRIHLGMFDAAQYPPASHAMVSCFQTMEHVYDPLLIAKSAYDLLQPGGIFYIVFHNPRGVLNRLLGTRSPIYDIEHLQLLTPKSADELMRRAGFVHVSQRAIWNCYPLHYWVKLLPLPRAWKERAIAALKRARIGHCKIALPVGNRAAVGRKP